MSTENKLSHLNQTGQVQMVNISNKPNTLRTAVAGGRITMQTNTLSMICDGRHLKGDVLVTAKIAAIQAAKRCSELIPLCHLLALTSVDIQLTVNASANCVNIEATCKTASKTGVEMEALTAVSVAALTIYDMCKAVDKNMVVDDIHLLKKQGGQSGNWQRAT